MNFFTSTTNDGSPTFPSAFEGSGGLNGAGGDATNTEAFERLLNLNHNNGTHQHGQDHNPFANANTNNTSEASLFAGFNNGNNDGACGYGAINGTFHGVNEGLLNSADQQQANLLSQLLMAQANGNTTNNETFGSPQFGGNQGNNSNNNGLFLTQQGFLNGGASNAAAAGGMTQNIIAVPPATSNTQPQATSSNNNNTNNFMFNAQQLLLMGQLAQQQQSQQQQATAIPQQQWMALLAGMTNPQIGRSNLNDNNLFAPGNMAAPTTTTIPQLLLQQQQQQGGNIFLPSPTASPLDHNHQVSSSSFHEFPGSGALANDVVSQGAPMKPVPGSSAPNVQAPLRALSAYNFFFRYQRERILNGEDLENQNDDSDNHWNMERQESLLQAHWGRDRTVKRRHRKSHGKISFGDLSKKISQCWKSLPEHRKDFFREVASKDWARYHRELTQHKLDLTTSAGQSAAATMLPLMGM